jgi:hypothetical protein
MPARQKRGPLSAAERQKILKWADSKSISDIAKTLNRTVDIITEFVTVHGAAVEKQKGLEIPATFKGQVYHELTHTLSWRQIKAEFSSKEIEIFKEKYVEFMWQFKNDVLPSERIQIIHVIKLDILMSRVLQEQNNAGEQISRLESQRSQYAVQFAGNPALMSDTDKDLLKTWENQLGNYRASLQSYTKEYTTLQKTQFDLMKSIKGTRDQRIKDIEQKQTSFIGLIKALQDQEFAEREGRHIELIKMAGQKAALDLGKPHQYMDEIVDLPIYSPENLEKLEKEGKSVTEE